ncbi:MAG: CBS domain-containing protein [Methermicoccaceae archaeon]
MSTEERTTVSSVMSTPAYVVMPDEPLSRVRNLMLKHRVSRLVVVDENRTPVGVITHMDILNHLNKPDAPWRRRPVDSIPVRNVMSDGLIKIHGSATLHQAAELMLENGIRGLPVVNDVLEGMITLQDLTGYVVRAYPDLLVRDVMDSFVVSVHTHHSVSHVIETMQQNDVDVVVVRDGGLPVGVITSTNLALLELTKLIEDVSKGMEVKMVRRDVPAGKKRYRYIRDVHLVAEDIMSKTMVVAHSNEHVSVAWELMVSENLPALPVMDEHEEPCGVISYEDIARILIKEEV